VGDKMFLERMVNGEEFNGFCNREGDKGNVALERVL